MSAPINYNTEFMKIVYAEIHRVQEARRIEATTPYVSEYLKRPIRSEAEARRG